MSEFKVTTAKHIGKRYYQEDRFCYSENKNGILACVFDGHGGSETAQTCFDLVSYAWKTIRSKTIQGKISKLFDILNKETLEHESGSTASIVYVPKDKNEVWIGVLGDSPVIVGNKDNYDVSPEHNVRSNQKEADDAKARGGWIEGGYLYCDNPYYDLTGDGLQMSRALGDKHLNRVLSRKPDIYSCPLEDGDFVLLASDGIFYPEHGDEEKIKQVVDLIADGKLAHDIVQHAIKSGSKDNCTAILIKKEL